MADEPVNFIREFVHYCEGTEIPDVFALWSAIAGISCAVGRRVWIDMGIFTLYPNLYIILTAPAGERKSVSVSQIKKVISQLSPRPNLIAQKVSPQALIEALLYKRVSSGEELVNFGNGEVVKQKNTTCTGFLIAPELGNFLNKQSYQEGMAGLLTDLFDCPADWDYHTRTHGHELLVNCCVGLLAASTIDWIKDAIPPSQVGSGLTSRIIFVYLNTSNVYIPFPAMEENKKAILGKLIKRLNEIAALTGPMRLTENAAKLYSDLYMDFRANHHFKQDKSLSSYVTRKGDHLLKLATILSLSESNEMVIKLNNIEGANAILLEAEKFMPVVMNLINESQGGSNLGIVLRIINANPGGVSRGNLLAAVSNRLNSRELSEILETLMAMGKIKYLASKYIAS